MGLDGVELVMAVEEDFEIAISDSEVEQCTTVGKLVDLVYSRLRKDARDPCPSQHGFYIIRKQIMNQLGVSRAAVKLDTKLANLIPRPRRRAVWQELVQAITNEKSAAPALVRPLWLNSLVMAFLPAAAFLITLKWVPLVLFWLGFFPAMGVAFVGDRLTTSFKTEFPLKCSRVRDLVRHVKTLDCKTWSKDEVLEKIRAISVRILGVKPEHVTLEAHWVDDLGVG